METGFLSTGMPFSVDETLEAEEPVAATSKRKEQSASCALKREEDSEPVAVKGVEWSGSCVVFGFIFAFLPDKL